MWFRCADYGLYWLTHDEDRRGREAPIAVPDDDFVPVRLPAERDWIWDSFDGATAAGIRVRFNWVCNPDFYDERVGKSPAKMEFPQTATAQTLAEFFRSQPQKLESVRLDEWTILNRNKNSDGFNLSAAGQRLVGWTPDRFVWYYQGTLTPKLAEVLEKYITKPWRFSPKHEVVGLTNEAGNWVLVSPWVTLTTDGRHLLREEYEAETATPLLIRYEGLLKQIHKYTESITPQRIAASMAGMKSSTHSITTRCAECQRCSSSHLEIHMARGEIDPYLIYSAYDAFGEVKFGGAVRQAWDLIETPTPTIVAEFQKVMRQFLLEALRPKVNGLTFMPRVRRAESNPWSLFGKARLRVVDGIRIAPGAANGGAERAMREGELLAAEAPRQRLRLELRPPRNHGLLIPPLQDEPRDIFAEPNQDEDPRREELAIDEFIEDEELPQENAINPEVNVMGDALNFHRLPNPDHFWRPFPPARRG